MCKKRKIEAPACDKCCRAKTINITYSECMPVALVIQHAIRMRHAVICGPSGFTILFNII